MKKFLLSFTAIAMALAFTATPTLASSSSQNSDQSTNILLSNDKLRPSITLTTVEYYDNAEGVNDKATGSGKMTTARETYDVTHYDVALSYEVGSSISQAWWELDQNLNIVGYGPEYMSVVRKPAAILEPRIYLVGSTMPHPSTARVQFNSEHFSFAEVTFVGQTFFMYNDGRYGYEVRTLSENKK